MVAQTTAKLLLVVMAVFSGGCAALIKGTGQDVSFTSTPPGAAIYVDGAYLGTTPIRARVSHGKDKQVEARLYGHITRQGLLTTSFSGYSLCLAYFSLLGDWMVGTVYTLDQKALHLNLEPFPGYAGAVPAGYPAGPGYPAAGFAPAAGYAPRPATAAAPAQPAPLPAPTSIKNKHLAVLEFQGRDLNQDVLMVMSDEVRGGAVNALLGHGVDIMTRENILGLLKDMGKGECTEGDCEVETARNIGADFVVTGSVVTIEKTYVVTLKLHETERGSLLGTESVEASSQIELKRALRENGQRLVARLLGRTPGRR